MSQSTLRVRKSFDQLTCLEYEHYFYVVRLLLIFPPEKQDITSFVFYRADSGDDIANIQKLVTPQCMYDALVAIHATCCEHRSEIFPYWHRWLFIRYEQYLLRAHQAVISQNLVTDQTERLLKLAQKINPKTTQDEIKELLKDIQKNYKEITKGQEITYIPGHYWNVFQPQKVINFPKGYISQKAYYRKSFTQVDKLIKLIWDQNSIYEINYKTRYEFPDLGSITRPTPIEYQKYQELIDNYAFWEQPENYPADYIKFAYDFIKKPSTLLAYKQYQKRKEPCGKQNLNKLIFNVLETKYVNYIFGGDGYNYYKNTTPSDPNNIDPTDPCTLKSTRNDRIGYYTYCRSLHTKSNDFITKFCTTANSSTTFSMQNPHNQMHNDQQYSMMDSSFSITNPIFFAYHSLIDLMLEYKINDLKQNVSSQSSAVAWISKYFTQDLTIHGTQDNGQYNYNFKNNWKKLKEQSNQGKPPKNQDYPVTRWISVNGANPSQDITHKDFLVDLNYSYKQIILTDKNTKLKNLDSLINVRYLSEQFKKNIDNILPFVPSPYSASGLYIALEIRYKSTISSTNLLLELRNMDGKILTTKTYPIFSRGKAGKCPNCTKFITNIVLFPIEELKQHFSNLINIRENGDYTYSAFSQVQSRINVASSLSYSISDQDVTARFVSGRKNLKITVKNAGEDNKKISFYMKSEESRRSKSKANEIFRSIKPITLQPGTNQKKIGTNQFNFLGVQADVEGKTINYNFPFYSEESEIVFDFGKHEDKIGLSKTACIGQTLNNVYEITQTNVDYPVIQSSGIKPYSMIKEEKAEEIKQQPQAVNLTYEDFE